MLTGWGRVEQRPNKAIRAGQIVQRYNDIPVGPAHAVDGDEETALCGARIVYTGNEWPSGMGPRCRECARLAASKTADP